MVIQVTCKGCGARYPVADEYFGWLGFCPNCQAEFMLPIPDAEQLLAWARTAPWDKLFRFMREGAAAEHSEETVQALICLYEQRRWAEEDRERRAAGRDRRHGTARERAWATSERRLRRRQTLEDLRAMDPYDFERFVASLFNAQGYKATAVGGAHDGGIDVEIYTVEGEPWAIAQCKRYGKDNRVTPLQIRALAGARELSGVEKAFLFTTGTLTSQARKTVRRLPWLRTYNGPELVDYIDEINSLAKDPRATS